MGGSSLRGLLAVVVLLAGCGPGGTPDLEVSAARAAVPAGGASQILVDVANHGDGADALVDVDTTSALDVEIHRTEIDDGRATMTRLDEVELPPGETVRFRPGSVHLMVVAPDESVVEGATLAVTLRFDRSGELTVEAEVVPLADIADDAVGE